MRALFPSLGVLCALLTSACGGSTSTGEAKPPARVAEVSLEADATAASGATPEDEAAEAEDALVAQMQGAGTLGGPSAEQADALALLLGAPAPGAQGSVLEGANVGEPLGVGGLGMRGVGPGGGGAGEGTVGGFGMGGGGAIGTAGGSMGTGRGFSGYGSGRAPSPPEPQIKLRAPTVQGALDAAIVQRIVRWHVASLRYCYEAEQARTPSLAGELRVALTIARDGRPAVVSIAGSTLHSAAVESCVLARFRTMVFPQPEKGVVLVEQAMEFTTPPPPPPPAPAAPSTPTP